MQIYCPGCHHEKTFYMPLWVRVTFRINEEGCADIQHVRTLESLEGKLVDHNPEQIYLTCSECAAPAELRFNEYEEAAEERAQRLALEKDHA